MHLSQWIKKSKRGERRRLSREAGVDYATLWRVERGAVMRSYQIAKRISDATGGAVSIADLCEAPRQKRKAA